MQGRSRRHGDASSGNDVADSKGSRSWRPGLSRLRVSAWWALPSKREWQRKLPKVDDAIAVGRQRAGLCKQALQIGGVPHGERGRFDDELVFLDLNLVESAYTLAAAVVRCKLTASQTESARASMMVALNLSFSILTLSKPLTYFMRCKGTARQDRDCLDACVDR